MGNLKTIAMIFAWIPGYLLYSVMAAWCFGAVWYSNLPCHWLRVTCALMALAVFISGPLAGNRWFFRGSLILMLAVVVWYILIPATNDRDWQPSFARNPYAVFEPGGEKVVIHDIRDFDYRSEDDFTVRYITETYDLNKLETMDYVQVHWNGLKVIAHSMLSFGFADGRHLVVSVETRLAKGDVQGGLPGFYKQFGLLMILGTERDLLGLRTNYRHEKVYLYPTRCSREEVRTVFLDILRRVNDLKEHPRFYNTVLHNCFTSLLPSLKLIRPQMRFDISMLFNGLTDRKAFEYQLSQGNVEGTFEQFRRKHYVNPKIDHMMELPADYSEVIRRSHDGK